MPLQAGGTKFDSQVVPYESDGSSTPGDALTITGGQVTQATDTDNVYGVHAHGSEDANAPADGDQIPVVVAGFTPVNVADGTTAGQVLAGSTTAGELTQGTQDGKSLVAYSDKEGQYNDATADSGVAPTGTAIVEVR